jgi:hypothetical protein
MVNELGLLLQFLTATYAKGRERRLGLMPAALDRIAELYRIFLGLSIQFLTTENTEYTEVVGTSFGTTNLALRLNGEF